MINFKSGNFWSIFLGMTSIVLAILLYNFANKEKKPVYSIKKEPSIVFDKNNASSKIRLLSNDSITINENVYITTIVVWNAGNLEINKKDIRKDFEIVTNEETEILDYSIINETHPTISNFKIIEKNNSLKIDWDYFDPKYGFELQVIYLGNKESEIFIKGTILGAKVEKVTARKKDNIKNVFWKLLKRILFSIGVFYVIISSVSIIGVILSSKMKENSNSFFTASHVIFGLFYLIIFIIYLIIYTLIESRIDILIFNTYTLPL